MAIGRRLDLQVGKPRPFAALRPEDRGIGLLPEFLCRQGLLAQKLRQVLPAWELPEQEPLCAVYPARLAEDARVIALVDFLSANIVPALAR